MKVLTILGTRPEIIRLSRVMARLDATVGIEHTVVHTGQNYDYELNEVFFEDLEVRTPDHFLNVSRSSIGAAYGDILAKSEAILLEEKPDAVLILGDTNSAIAAVIAKRMHIPVFHMEAGNRSFDPNVPEEVNRKIVDHVSDFNLVYTEHARRNLLSEGLSPRRIYLTGSPMREVLAHQMPKIDASTATADLGLDRKKFFLVSAHREENVDVPERLNDLLETLQTLRATYDYPVVVSLHPRTAKRLKEAGLGPAATGANTGNQDIVFHPPFGFSDYCRLQLDAACVLSDSGTITEESSILGFPAITIRDSIERPEGLDSGAIILGGLTWAGVGPAIAHVLNDETAPLALAPSEYQIVDCSRRTVSLLVGLSGRSNAWHGLYERGSL